MFERWAELFKKVKEEMEISDFNAYSEPVLVAAKVAAQILLAEVNERRS